MHDFAKMRFVYNLSRGISTCAMNLNKYISREGKFMTKIMRGEQGKRKWYMQSDRISANNVVGTKRPALPQDNRRNTVLNKLFMKYITDLMATGEVASGLVGRGIEVTRVSVTPDFHQVNVFWLAKEIEEKDTLVEEILARAEGPLRHELSQLRVMGVVPTIKFVRDKQYMRFIEVDRKLAMADFGEDYVPTDPTLRLKTAPVLNVKLPPGVWSSIQKLELDMDEDEMESAEEPLPEMRNDVLGLDRARIMAKVKSSMDKSKTAFQNRSLNIVSPLPRDTEQISKATAYLSVKERNAAFSAFLTKRQLEEKQRRKFDMGRYENDEDELHSFDEMDFDEEDDFLAEDIQEEDIEER